jgi:hypothetical protein
MELSRQVGARQWFRMPISPLYTWEAIGTFRMSKISLVLAAMMQFQTMKSLRMKTNYMKSLQICEYTLNSLKICQECKPQIQWGIE